MPKESLEKHFPIYPPVVSYAVCSTNLICAYQRISYFVFYAFSKIFTVITEWLHMSPFALPLLLQQLTPTEHLQQFPVSVRRSCIYLACIVYLHEKQLIPESRVVFGWILFLNQNRKDAVNNQAFYFFMTSTTDIFTLQYLLQKSHHTSEPPSPSRAF